MKQDIQRVAAVVGRTGCYYLCVLQLAQQLGATDVDPLHFVQPFVARGWLGDDCFMKAPQDILAFFVPGHWRVRKAGAGHELPLDYALLPNEYEILRFERPLRAGEAASAETAHFVRGIGHGPLDKTRIIWDPWVGSQAVEAGTLVSRRIIGRA